eukprot:g19263.t1
MRLRCTPSLSHQRSRSLGLGVATRCFGAEGRLHTRLRLQQNRTAGEAEELCIRDRHQLLSTARQARFTKEGRKQEPGSNAMMRWLRGTPIDVNYDFRRWRKHQVATRHILLWSPRNALRWDLLRRLLFPDLAWLGLNSSLLCLYNVHLMATASPILSVPLVTVTMPSFALGLLITFKTQSGYERFIEGRTLWEHLLREHWQQLDGCNPHIQLGDRAREEEVQRATTRAFQAELGRIWDMTCPEERAIVDRILTSAANRPLQILHELQHLNSSETWSKTIREGGLKGTLTVPITLVISFFMLGIEDIGSRVEQPFDVLPLWQYCEDIENSCNQLLEHSRMLGRLPEHTESLENAMLRQQLVSGELPAPATSVSMPGSTSSASEANDEIKSMCTTLKEIGHERCTSGAWRVACVQAQAGGWNGLFSEFTAISYTSQVVAGTNYFVKVKVGDGKFCHLRVHQPLPHTGQPPAVHSLQMDKAEGDAIEYF